MEGVVRAILDRHAQASLGHDASRAADPNALLPAPPLAAALAHLGVAEQRRLGADYARLWARTFRILVSHLRGRPERALALFVDEVYPFLRGDRRAARVERAGPGSAALTLAGDLPTPYLCGLVEGFVGLSGASVSCRATGSGTGVLEVRYRIGPSQLLARLSDRLATLRLGLVAAIVVGALFGIALAAQRGSVSLPRALLVVVGAAAAQFAANALHDLRHAHPAGPLAPFVVRREILVGQLAAAGLVAIAVAAWLAVTGTPLVLLFAGAGLLVALLYAPLRGHGLGPLVMALLYGPLVAEGALHAFDASGHVDHLVAAPFTLIPGALAAAVLYLDDLADAPLDEAGGKRTLAVRLPHRRQAGVFAGLLAVGLVPLAVLDVLEPTFPPLLLFAPVGAAGVYLARSVARNREDPHKLAPARLGTQLLHVVATALAALLWMVLA